MQLVAITGKRGHGKSTAAGALEDLGWKHINFADPLRQIAMIAYGLSMHEMLDPVLKETPLTRWPYKSPREILQRIGTEMFRGYVDDTWIEAFKRAAGEHDRVVCSDCRFLNEGDAVRALGGALIRVINPHKAATDVASQHASETEMDSIIVDHTLVNGGSIADLKQLLLDTLKLQGA